MIANAPFVVVLDAGHGGPNAGCIAAGGKWREKDWTLAMAHLARSKLLEATERVAVELTREKDEFLPLSSRAALAAKHGADLVISIHVNSFDDAAAHGAMVFHLRDELGSTAQALADAMPAPLRRKRNGVVLPNALDYPRVVNVLSRYECPAVLLEAGFFSNRDDVVALRDPSVQESIAKAIVAATLHALAIQEAENVGPSHQAN